MDIISIPLEGGDQYRLTKRTETGHDISRISRLNDEYEHYFSRKATEAEADMAIMIDALRDLVKHCWVHSGCRDCGRAQMDYRMREMYDKINNGADD